VVFEWLASAQTAEPNLPSRLFLSEFFNVVDFCQNQGSQSQQPSSTGTYYSDLLGSVAYLDELACLLVVLFRSLPNLLLLEVTPLLCKLRWSTLTWILAGCGEGAASDRNGD